MKNGWILEEGGFERHYKDGKLHGQPGRPAVIGRGGSYVEWWMDGKPFCPAVIYTDGTDEYGPAVSFCASDTERYKKIEGLLL